MSTPQTTPNTETLPSSSASPPFTISPPLLNSANPWCTTEEDLLALYACPFTGAVTIRTSLWGGFRQEGEKHQYTFYDPGLGHSPVEIQLGGDGGNEGGKGGGVSVNGHGRPKTVNARETTSLNTLGYSPISFEEYMRMLVNMRLEGKLRVDDMSSPTASPPPPSDSTSSPLDGGTTSLRTKRIKPFIISVTGSPEEVARCATYILTLLNAPSTLFPAFYYNPSDIFPLDLMMEINLSCPNISSQAQPPAYSAPLLTSYLSALSTALATLDEAGKDYGWNRKLHIGLKTPPYTYAAQFHTLISCLEASSPHCPISFITATNTLGNCLVLSDNGAPALGSETGLGIGGLGGESIHALSLGNVKMLRALLDASACEDVRRVQVIGVGGVGDRGGYERMRSVGACAVGVGTALGREGVGIFEKISKGVVLE